MQAVADALTVLLEPGSFADRTTRFLECLGNAAGVDRAYYFENDPGSAPLTCSQRCEWVREGISRELHNPLLQHMDYESMLPDILPALSSGRTFSILTKNCASPLREILQDQSILSMALMPVHSHGDFLGFIGFDDCHTERIWRGVEIESLRAASAGLGNTILRHKMEEAMTTRAEELARSRRVALSLMEDAQKAVMTAEQANRAKSAFLAMMSHEIRTPLNGVIGFTDLLLEENLPPHHAELVSTIRSCGNSLLGLISDILDLSKIESGRLDLEMLPCSLHECLRDVLVSFEPVLSAKKLTISSRVGDTVPGEVVTDPKRLRQILFNLVGNAVKFTSEGEISVALDAIHSTGGRFLLSGKVSDTGIGIPLEEQQRIFEAFGQADASIHRRFGGSGLGLAICRKLIEALGGKISVESSPGRGTSFHFTFPAYTIRKTPHSEHPESPAGDIAGLKILAVDDVQTNLRLMTGILRKMGCQAATATDGREAVSLLAQDDFDIVFMDVLMPVCDGLEATRQIREMEKKAADRKPSYIVALTADAFAENKTRCLEAGMDEFLTKPLRMYSILSAIERGVRRISRR